MLFRKELPRSCSYCVWGTATEKDAVLCPKKGFKTAGDSCRKYVYDPSKRTPARPKPLDFSKYNEEDFKL